MNGILVRIGNAAFDLDKVVAVEGDRVVFDDGKEIRISNKTKEALLDAIGALGGAWKDGKWVREESGREEGSCKERKGGKEG